MKILITGSSGVGKSTVIDELRKLGYTAIDGDDEPGFVQLEIRETGEPADWPAGYVDWHHYAWNLQSDALKRALARDETVFVGGIYNNQAEFYPLFDIIIALHVSADKHGKNLTARPARSFGDDAKNIENKLSKYPVKHQSFLDAGAKSVDANGSPAETAQKILKLVEHAD
jgi:dephospho-CoA kinase